MKTDKEDILHGGQNAESVVKIGNTVHRTKGSNYKFIHSLLLYLEQQNFPYAPRLLGIDDKHREVLIFIEGTVPRDISLTIKQKIAAIKILRKLHDVLANTSFSGVAETVCHNDFAPWNIIIKNEQVVGIIDFDDAVPGKRIDDVSYFIWTFLELGNSKESDQKQIENIAELVNAYGLENKEDLILAFIRQHNRILKFRNQIIIDDLDSSMVKFSKSAILRIQKSRNWIELNKCKIINAI